MMEIRLARHSRPVAVVTVDNQPRLNAMTRAMLSELGRLWDKLERDGDSRCIILTGAGQRAFTVGADVSGDLSAGPEVARMVNHALLKNDPYSKPIVAAVNGDCVGGGLELMLSTDIRAAAPEARFGLTEVKWSIYPFGGSTIKLIQRAGLCRGCSGSVEGRARRRSDRAAGRGGGRSRGDRRLLPGAAGKLPGAGAARFSHGGTAPAHAYGQDP